MFSVLQKLKEKLNNNQSLVRTENMATKQSPKIVLRKNVKNQKQTKNNYSCGFWRLFKDKMKLTRNGKELNLEMKLKD